MFRFELALLALVAAAGSAVGCTTPTSTTHVFAAQDIPTRAPMRQVIVFARGMSEGGRRATEDAFVASLGERGVTARPSYELFPTMPEPNAVRAAVQGAGFDGVLVTTLRGVDTRSGYMPGSSAPRNSPLMDGYEYGGVGSGSYGSGSYGSIGGSSGPNGSMGWTGPQEDIVTDRIVDVETNLWDLRGSDGRGTLVWSAKSQTENPSSAGDTAKSLTKEIVPKMTAAGIIGEKPR